MMYFIIKSMFNDKTGRSRCGRMSQLTGLLSGDTSAEYSRSPSSAAEERTSADLSVVLQPEHTVSGAVSKVVILGSQRWGRVKKLFLGDLK